MRAAAVALALLLTPGAVLAQPGARALLAEADADHDGRVTWAEAWGAIQRRYVAADTDRDGGLRLEEWQAAKLPSRPALPNRPPPDPQRLQERRAALFRALDADRNAVVALEEIRPVAEAWFRAFDADGDGALTADELPRPRQRQPAAR